MGYETGLRKRDKIFWSMKDFVFPMSTYCMCCGKIIDNSRRYSICDVCSEKIEWGKFKIDLEREERETGRKSLLDGVYAALHYGPFERRLIFDLKYDARTYVARVIAKIMFERVVSDFELAEELLAADYIIPVPISKERMRERGFNQTEKIGKYLSKYFDIPMDDGIILRTANTKWQKTLSRDDRYMNLKNAFSVPESAKNRLKGKSVIVIDDCYTTGATANAMAEKLKEAGADKVYFYVLASGNDFMVE